MPAKNATKQNSRDEAEIFALLASLRAAHHDKNAEAIAACYAPEATICDLAPPLARRGVDVAAKQAWLDAWEGPIELETPTGALHISGDLAIHYGYTRMSGRPTAAGREVDFWLRDTICLKRQNRAWRIVHMHSSVPFHMEGVPRPAFDLRPSSI